MTRENFYPNDDPETAAEKLAKDSNRFVIPENGKGKQKEKKIYFVQKHSGSDLLAEAVIVAGIPYFALSKSNSRNITLEESIPISDTSEYRPFDASAYLNEPYRFRSKEDFE
jgi:hypothetical protein